VTFDLLLKRIKISAFSGYDPEANLVS